MDISVIAPIYNEEENIIILVERLKNVLAKNFREYEIILINDGSVDDSKKILDLIKDEVVRVYHFEKNCGQTAAIAAGFKYATGEIIVTIDADLQTDPEDIPLLCSYVGEYDMINGKRASREDGIIRKISSLVGNGMRNIITNDNIKDTGCPLKLFKKEVVDSFYLYEGMHRFLPTLAKINGFNVIEIPVKHHDRMYGVSKYGVWNRLFKGLRDAFAVRWMKKRHLAYKINISGNTHEIT